VRTRTVRGTKDVRELIDTLKSVDLIMHRTLWQKLNLKLKPGHVVMMLRLAESARTAPEGLRVSELASAFNVTASGVTQVVTVLEEQGLVVRRMDPDDRRAVRVSLTEQGLREGESVRMAMDRIFSGLVAHLGREKSRRLLTLLTEVAAYFDGLNVPDASASGEN